MMIAQRNGLLVFHLAATSRPRWRPTPRLLHAGERKRVGESNLPYWQSSPCSVYGLVDATYIMCFLSHIPISVAHNTMQKEDMQETTQTSTFFWQM